MPEWTSEWLTWQFLGRMADVVSLLTLPVTGWAGTEIWRLRRQMAFNAVLRSLVDDIRETIEDITTLDAASDHRMTVSKVRGLIARLHAHRPAMKGRMHAITGVLNDLDRQLKGIGPQKPVAGSDELQALWTVHEELTIFQGLAKDALVSRDLGGRP